MTLIFLENLSNIVGEKIIKDLKTMFCSHRIMPFLMIRESSISKIFVLLFFFS